MKQKIVQLSGVLLIMLGLITACSEEEINTQQPEEECPEALAELITGDVERFHRLGLDQIVEEMELHPGSGIFETGFEEVMDLMGENVNDFAEAFDWNFEPDPDGLKVTQDEINSFTALFQHDTKSWFGILAKQLKTTEDPDYELVDFDKIAHWSGKMGEIITTDSEKKCTDEHLDHIQKKLDELMLDATDNLNEYEAFIVSNMATVGLSSLGSWSEIATQWTENKDDDPVVNWRHVGELAEADLIAGGLACMAGYKKIAAATVLGGIKGFLISAGGIFGGSSLVGSAGYAVYHLMEAEDDQESK